MVAARHTVRAWLLWLFVPLSLCMISALASPGRAQQTVSMPTGPASMQGLGEGFGVNAATGTGSFSIPIELPPALFAPSLSLEYASGSGRDVAGLSFELPVTSIYRTTNRGAPDFDEDDRFAVEGRLSGELVRVNAARGYYRLRTEGANALFVRDAGNDRWRIRHPDGTEQWLGSEQQSQQKSRGRTFRWYVSTENDAFGHEIRYTYGRDQGRVYLERIEYQLEAMAHLHNLVELVYERRPDAFVDFSSGDEVVTARRIRQVVVSHGERVLRRYTFAYEEGLLFSLLREVRMEGEQGLSLPPLTFQYYQSEPAQTGAKHMDAPPPLEGLLDGAATLEDVNRDGLDDILYGLPGDWYYYENLDGQRWSSERIALTAPPDRGLYEDDVLLADMNGDGARDVVARHGDDFRYFPVRDVQRGRLPGFALPVKLTSDEGDFHLRDPEVTLADLNYDGRIDVLMQKPGDDAWLLNGADEHLRSQRMPELPVDVVLHDPRVQLTDFNGDGTQDFVRMDTYADLALRVRVWHGYGAGRFAPSRDMRNVPMGAWEEFSLQDLNNDGQADLVRTSGSWATFYLNDGRGSFTGARAHYYDVPAEVDTQRRLFADMNGNGTTDLVRVTWRGELIYLDLVGQPFNGLLRTIDNGMGLVTMLTYRSSTDYLIAAKRQGQRWATTLPTPIPVVATMESTDSLDVLGLPASRTRVEYAYADGHYDGVRRVFRAFGDVEVYEPGDANHEGVRVQTRYHVGKNLATGQDEEALAGLAYAQFVRGEDGALYSTRETAWELKALCREEHTGAARDVFPSCQDIRSYAKDKDRMLVVPLATASLSGSWEKTDRPRYSATRTRYDAWGFPIASEALGEVRFGEVHEPGAGFDLDSVDWQVGADEAFSQTDLIHDVERWKIGVPFEQRVLDAQNHVLGRSRTFFDGPPLLGLALGQITRGLPTRTQAWLAEESRWIDVNRVAYSEHGLVEVRLDATGVRSEVDYDVETGSLPVTQRLFLSGRPAEFHATFDTGYGLPRTTTDANGETSEVHYDGFGRVREVVDPLGDVIATYDYQQGSSTHPVSVLTVGALRRRGTADFDYTHSYSDAFGRTRQVKEEADELGYVASGWVELSRRGLPVRTFQPFASRALGLEPPAQSTPSATSQYDAVGRAVYARLPATEDAPEGSDLFTEFLPFEVHGYDERASNDPEAAFPSVTRFDGLGRAHEQLRRNLDEDGLQTLVWSQVFDAMGRVVAFRDPAWHAAQPESPTRSRHERRYRYDSLSRLIELADANLGSIRYTYDDAGRPLSRTDALAQVRRMTYDDAGRILAQTFENDVNGRPDYRHDFHYDRADPNGPLRDATGLIGRLAWVEHPTGTEHISYDALGQPERSAKTLWDPARSSFTNQTRDLFTRAVRYDPTGQPIEVTLPGGLDVDLTYDARGLLRSVRGDFGEGSRTVYDHASYDALGALWQVDQGNATRTCNGRDARGRRTRALTGSVARTDCRTLSAADAFRDARHRYTFDSLIASITDSSVQRAGVERVDASFGYDWLQQLAHVDGPRASYEYRHDATQNLTGRTRTDAQGTVLGFFRYGENTEGPNRLTSQCEEADCTSGTAYAYDALGRLLRYRGYDLSYDVQGRLVRAHREGSSQVEYHYDHAGRRVIVVHKPDDQPARIFRHPFEGYRERDGEKVWTIPGPEGETEVVGSEGIRVDLYLLDQLQAYLSSGGARLKPLPDEYMDLDGDGDGFDAGDLSAAQIAYEQERPVGGARTIWRWVHPDQVLSSTHVSDRTGELVSHTVYTPYGHTVEQLGLASVRGFTGAERESDVDLGLIRMGSRYYAAELGRWLTPDEYIGESPALMWSRPLEANLYSYAGNNPVNFRDPKGRFLDVHAAQAQLHKLRVTAGLSKKKDEPDVNYPRSGNILIVRVTVAGEQNPAVFWIASKDLDAYMTRQLEHAGDHGADLLAWHLSGDLNDDNPFGAGTNPSMPRTGDSENRALRLIMAKYQGRQINLIEMHSESEFCFSCGGTLPGSGVLNAASGILGTTIEATAAGGDASNYTQFQRHVGGAEVTTFNRGVPRAKTGKVPELDAEFFEDLARGGWYDGDDGSMQ